MHANHPPAPTAWIPAAVLLLACLSPAEVRGADEPVSNPLGGGAGATLEPVPTVETPRRRRSIFACRDSGTPTFSDRPCGASAQPQFVALDPVTAGGTSSVVPLPTGVATRPRPLPVATVPPRSEPGPSRCQTLRRQLDALDDRMRTGYSAREAAGLWNRWRDLRAELRSNRC